MICTKALRRIECCSLYGLVAFLRALFNTVTEHDALWYLLVSNIDAASAVNMAEQHGHVMSGAYQDAYSNAALNSWHPDPDASSKLTMSLLEMELVELSFLLNGHVLSNTEVEQLGIALSAVSEKQASPLDHEEILSVNQKRFISDIRKKFQDDQEFFARKVNAALYNYSKENGGHFEIHVICGVNANVNEGAWSHINFWATPKGSNISGTTPILFFAECSNDSDKEEESLCFCVSSTSIDSVRCFHCEYHGIKIVHPCDEVYHGSGNDFNVMALGNHSISNELVISACQFHVDMVCVLDEDWIYFDPKLDAKIAEKNTMEDGAFKLWRWKGRIF